MLTLKNLLVPDRFENLKDNAQEKLSTIIVEVRDALEKLDDIYEDMITAARGAFLILKGDSGSGKSTFLNTINLFREDVVIETINNDESISETLKHSTPTDSALRIFILEGREALRGKSTSEIEIDLHSINTFLRSKKGERTLVVWLCNTEDMKEILIQVADAIGGDALLGIDEPFYDFHGPQKKDFLDIAKRTVQLLNNGASLNDMGITDEQASQMANNANTIGRYFNGLRKELRANTLLIKKLTGKEQFKMWVVVLAGNEPENDVAALTRGQSAIADIERMMVSTQANIVTDLKQYPEKLGLLSNVFDCKIIYIPILTATAIARDYADNQLIERMKEVSLNTKADSTGKDRLLNSELYNAFSGNPSGPRKKGKTGNNSREAFEKLARIASTNDKLINKTFGEAMIDLGLISNFSLEEDLGQGLTRRTDILCEIPLSKIRVEMMWRTKTSRAEIANYTLTKLYNYGKAIGYLT
jgi:energy-coupling factor transporter ATP-binding protein EcfA2